MRKISPEQYVEGVNSIYIEQPTYRTGGDGSDGTCDCIGMCRGALKRKGVDPDGMGGTNYAARRTILGLQKIKKAGQLQLGDVVLKVWDKDDKDMPLPDRYRKGQADYDETVGETNFTHIGTVTQVSPLRITHMTSPTAKIDTNLGKWCWFGKLPWVEPEELWPDPEDETATVWAESGKTVKMRAKPSTLCRLYWNVPVGETVIVTDRGETWSAIIWNGLTGYMMTKFLKTEQSMPIYGVIISGITRETAEEIVAKYGGEITAG